MDARLYSKRNPYDEAELFATLERMRRLDELDAEEFINFNTVRALPYMGGKAPIIMEALV